MVLSIWRKQPKTVPTDKIIPLRVWDDSPSLRYMAFDFTMQFNDVLDPSKLEAGLDQLLDTGEWRQLGARLRANVRDIDLTCRMS